MKKKLFGFIQKFKNKVLFAAATVAGILSGGICTVTATDGFGYTGPSGTDVMDGNITLATSLGIWLGGAWLIFGIVTLVMSIRNEDNEGRNKALINIACGVVLLSIGTVLTWFGIKKSH